MNFTPHTDQDVREMLATADRIIEMSDIGLKQFASFQDEMYSRE